MSRLQFAIKLYNDILIGLFLFYREPAVLGTKSTKFTFKDYVKLPYTAYSMTRFQLNRYF